MQHIIVNCVKFFKSFWQIIYKSRELSLALLLFLSSIKELSLSYFVAKSRQSYWQIVELIKGVVLEVFCFRSPEFHFGNREATLSRKP